MSLTAVSLFSGCGGFDYGAQQAGLDIIWANDIDPHAASAYRSILPDVKFIEGNIADIKLENIPQAEVLIGCYPCTGFSEASRRRGKKRESRDLHTLPDNFLYKEFLRVLEHVRPKYLFVENVKGMLSAAGGWFWHNQKAGFKQRGYEIANAALVASNFGVAQDRKRVFIVGVRSDIAARFEYVFPKPTHGKGLKPKMTLVEALRGLPEWPEGEFNNRPFHGHYLTRNRKRSWHQQGYTVVAHWDHVTLHPSGEPMKKTGKDAWELQGDVNRRFSWRECARLQGLPDHIKPSGTLKNSYQVIGNAVPPSFAKILIEPIVANRPLCFAV